MVGCRGRWWLHVAVAVAAFFCASPAAAHPLVDAGRRHLDEADFRRALEAFSRAENASDLSRDDLLLLLESRALVYVATHDDEALDRELVRLATIDPDHRFRPDAPPELAERFGRARRRARERLSVRIDAERLPNGSVRLQPSVEHDEGSLLRHVHVFARGGRGTWTEAVDEPLLVERPRGAVRYHALAVGPGGAVIAELGSRESPRTLAGAEGAADQAPAEPAGDRIPESGEPATAPAYDQSVDATTDDDGGGGSTWIWVGAGALAVAAVIVTVVLVSGGTSDVTQPGAPTVSF